MRLQARVVALIVALLLGGSPALAEQRHIVDAVALNQAIADRATTDEANREAVVGALRSPAVRAVAARLGLNVTRAEAAAATLTSAELADLAAVAESVQAAQAEHAGGAEPVMLVLITLLLVTVLVAFITSL